MKALVTGATGFIGRALSERLVGDGVELRVLARDPRRLAVPANVTLAPLPPYSPELNPVERVWLHLRERFLSLRVFADYQAIVDACCAAWNRLVAEPGRLRSLGDQPWIRNVSS